MPFTPNFSNINTATGNTLSAEQLGAKAVQINTDFRTPVATMSEGVAKLTGSTSLPVAPSTTSTPVVPSSGAPPLPSSGSSTPTPTSITPTGQVAGVLSTAKGMAREDDASGTIVRYVAGPDGVVRPTIEISGARVVDDGATQWAMPPPGAAGPGAPPPMPEASAPPLVSAPPTKKKTSPMLWLGLVLAAAVLLD